jgi:hypothetical protein
VEISASAPRAERIAAVAGCVLVARETPLVRFGAEGALGAPWPSVETVTGIVLWPEAEGVSTVASCVWARPAWLAGDAVGAPLEVLEAAELGCPASCEVVSGITAGAEVDSEAETGADADAVAGTAGDPGAAGVSETDAAVVSRRTADAGPEAGAVAGSEAGAATVVPSASGAPGVRADSDTPADSSVGSGAGTDPAIDACPEVGIDLAAGVDCETATN